MKNTLKVFNLIILDESGSMQSIKNFIIQGFNELVQSVKSVQAQFPEQEHMITMVSFNSDGVKTLLNLAPVNQLEPIDENKYRPGSMTPLYDAMGVSINKMRKELEDQSDYNVLVTILTDGEENASKEYDGPAIKKLVDELKLKNWTFTYIGTDHDIERFAHSISITNTLFFSKNKRGINQMFAQEKDARHLHCRIMRTSVRIIIKLKKRKRIFKKRTVKTFYMQPALFTPEELHHIPQNEREAVLYYFSHMDVGMLSEILDDNRTYQNAHKEVFLEKTEGVFEEFKKKGDTLFKVVKGECGSNECLNKGCKGYAFIGNNSGCHLDLIIDEMHEKVIDIYHCNDFKIYNEGICLKESLSIDIYPDEEAGFKPSEEYLLKLHYCNIAYDEMISDEMLVIDLQHLSRWLDKYWELYDSIDIFSEIFSKLAKFHTLYYHLKDLMEYTALKEEALSALISFETGPGLIENEALLLDWLVKFEELGSSKLCLMNEIIFDNEEDPKIDWLLFRNYKNLYVNSMDLSEQRRFKKLFDSYYWAMLNKYRLFSDEELFKLDQQSEHVINQASLKYQLEQRNHL